MGSLLNRERWSKKISFCKKTIAFDKTGTITQGQLSVDQVQPINAGITLFAELVGLATSVEQESSHIFS